jgi:ankyrin repeat protein
MGTDYSETFDGPRYISRGSDPRTSDRVTDRGEGYVKEEYQMAFFTSYFSNLIGRGTCLNSKKNRSWTALMEASYRGNIKAVQELLDHGADPNLQDEDGDTALMFASLRGYTDMVSLLLLDHGTDPNLRNDFGWSALMYASYMGRIDMARLLLDHGADPNLQNVHGWTALMEASNRGCTDMVRLLKAAVWNRNVSQPLIDLDIFPEGLIREHLTV